MLSRPRLLVLRARGKFGRAGESPLVWLVITTDGLMALRFGEPPIDAGVRAEEFVETCRGSTARSMLT